MKMNWSKEQLQAINIEAGNVLVSAGAGSGKTAVLTARVIRKLKSGVSLDDLLILTFTNAAADEMKERIRKALSKETNLQKQLLKVDNALIMTFDAYALHLVKKYHHLLNLSKNLSIVDQNILALKENYVIKQIFEDYYNNPTEEFLKLIEQFVVKNDDTLIKNILSLYRSMQLISDLDTYLINYETNFINNEHYFKLFSGYMDLLFEQINHLKNYLDLLGLNAKSEEEYESLIVYRDILKPLLNSTTYDEIKKKCDEIDFSPVNKKSKNIAKPFREVRKEITKARNELKSLLIYDSQQEILSSLANSESNVILIIEIINELHKQMQQFKLQKEVFSFMDIAKLAIRLLKENPYIQNEIKNSLNEILLDEYQDTSDIQEDFINLIANENVYMVGDVKQSIYRFRNANPYIFMKKYDDYANKVNGSKIDMNKNFRSRKEVIQDINNIFSVVMSKDFGGADYISNHIIEASNVMYENEGRTNQNQFLEIYNYQHKIIKEEEIFEYKFTKPETEAFIIAQDILEKIENKFQIYDSKLKQNRNITFADFTILIDKTTQFSIFKKVFSYFGIPLTMFVDEDMKDEDDTLVFKNILNLIHKYNLQQFDQSFKHSFASVARSFLIEMSDLELYKIITNNNFYDNVIFKKIKPILDEYNILSLASLCKQVIEDFDFYYKIIKNHNVDMAKARIDNLIKISEDFNKVDGSVAAFIEFLNDLNKYDYDLKISLPQTDSTCKIMTIHKSKGLEFSFCYFPLFSNRFNLDELKSAFIFDDKLGIISDFYSDETRDNIAKFIYKNNFYQAEISEKIRLLYVALTRTKEKMVIVGDFHDLKDEQLNKKEIEYRSFQNIVQLLINETNFAHKFLDVRHLNLTRDYKISKKKNYEKEISKDYRKIEYIPLKDMSFYKEDKKFSVENLSILDSKTLQSIEYGNYLHELLFVIDFNNYDLKKLGLDNQTEYYLNKFLTSDLLKNLNKAKIYKEYEFMYEDENNSYHGFIDLIIELPDCIKIIDYKLKDIDNKNYLKQLEGYRKYLLSKTNKKIEVYLYSLVQAKYKQIY